MGLLERRFCPLRYQHHPKTKKTLDAKQKRILTIARAYQTDTPSPPNAPLPSSLLSIKCSLNFCGHTLKHFGIPSIGLNAEAGPALSSQNRHFLCPTPIRNDSKNRPGTHFFSPSFVESKNLKIAMSRIFLCWQKSGAPFYSSRFRRDSCFHPHKKTLAHFWAACGLDFRVFQALHSAPVLGFKGFRLDKQKPVLNTFKKRREN